LWRVFLRSNENHERASPRSNNKRVNLQKLFANYNIKRMVEKTSNIIAKNARQNFANLIYETYEIIDSEKLNDFISKHGKDKHELVIVIKNDIANNIGDNKLIPLLFGCISAHLFLSNCLNNDNCNESDVRRFENYYNLCQSVVREAKTLRES